MAHTLATDLVVSNISAKYRLVSKLGEGGMGKVYLAEQTADTENPKNIGRQVALKFLELELALSQVPAKDKEERYQDLMSRFVSEGRLGFKLRHPHIIPTLDYGMDQADRPFLVSRFVEGVRPLSALIAYMQYQHGLSKEGSEAKPKYCLVPWSMLVQTAYQVADALAYMHQEQVAHRDIKPENILFTGEGQNTCVYIVDLGIAKNLNETTNVKRTRDGHIVGTLTNMSPEQIFPMIDPAGKKWDKGPYNDVYSFGTVLYELMTGRYYFRMDPNESEYAFAHRIIQDEPIPLTNWIDEPNKEIEHIISRCLVKEPWLRPTMAEIQEELRVLCQKPSSYPEPYVRIQANKRSVNPEAQTVASIPSPPVVIPKAAAIPREALIGQSSDDELDQTQNDQRVLRQKKQKSHGALLLISGLVGAGITFYTFTVSEMKPMQIATKEVSTVEYEPPVPTTSTAVVAIVDDKPVPRVISPLPTGADKKIYDNGIGSYKLKDWRRAEIAMRIILEKQKYTDLPQAILIRAECLIQLKRVEEARPLLKQYLEYPGTAKSDLSGAALSLVP